MPALTREGWYLCDVVTWGVREAESHAVAIALKLETRAEWQPDPVGIETPNRGSWVELPALDVFGDFYIIKKDGQPNPTAIEQLTKAKCWNGEYGLMLYEKDPPMSLQAVVQVGANVYQGKTTYRANWIHHADHVPGAGGISGRVAADRLAELNATFGGSLRAATPKLAELTKAAEALAKKDEVPY